ncbi:hypothetical protein [Streptomyces parvulus]|uniref:Uncharacterized protein n=1 Tax=Streptomyces parvulus TaxID=146923 RepID=A0A191UWN3_9ACTN|nr:hypothetical protein [Streptomyces parvulus]ANJ07156.1 hypothetical protein Spa2297_09150 [Streptomyces parvulus]GGR74347.1 hypothetical protein GCM10010220_28310 [Streptomyces parvulus]
MNQKAETPRAESGAFRKDSAAGGKSAVTVPQDSDNAQQGDGLFPADPAPTIARPVPVQTSGRLEFAARCPECRTWHRHVSLGEKDAPCGAHYRLEFASKGAAA